MELLLTLGMFLCFFIAGGTGGCSVVATNFLALAIITLLLGCIWTVDFPKGGTQKKKPAPMKAQRTKPDTGGIINIPMSQPDMALPFDAL